MACLRPFAALKAALALLAARCVQAADPFTVRCSTNCRGHNTCSEMCVGELTQIGKCLPQAACPKPDENQVLCPNGPQPCQFSAWGPWKNDTEHCSGLCIRTRTIAEPNVCGGAPCKGPLTETKPCPDSCDMIQPKDCTFTLWSTWSVCGTPTKNQRQRTRTIGQKPVQSGFCEGELSQTEVCGAAVMGAACAVSPWMEWNECSKTCGGGQQIRFRTIMQRAVAGGLACTDAISETAACNVGVACGVTSDCAFSAWSAWIGCGPTGGQQKMRTRTVSQPAVEGGKACSGKLQETLPCDSSASIKVDCELSTWSQWKLCDKTCGGGQTFRTRSPKTQAQHGGAPCSGSVKETKECHTQSCDEMHPELNCKTSTWVAWSACSASCGVGSQTRKRSIAAQAKPGGAPCTGPLELIRGCPDNAACPINDCKWGQWGAWSTCPVTCGEAHQRRERSIIQNATAGGKACLHDDMAEVQPCATNECKKHCTDGTWGEWQAWSTCTKTCRGGYKYQKRSIATLANHCGKNTTGVDTMYQRCTELDNVKCPGDEDCALSAWSVWAECSDKCGGTQTRSRSVSQHGVGHGDFCGDRKKGAALEEIRPCNSVASAPCSIQKKVDCELGAWATWGVCSSTCNGGTMSRSRKVVSGSRTGAPCKGELSEVKSCNDEIACSTKVNCKWGAWAEWSTCTKCSGQKFRTREVAQLPVAGGKPCRTDATREIKRCPKDCGQISKYFCIWSDWSAWGACQPADVTKGCGNGTRTRQMVLHATEQVPGEYASLADRPEDCKGKRLDRDDCTANVCTACVPQDCLFGPWLAWSWPNCEGICTRTRSVKQQRNDCGKPCTGSVNSTKACEGKMKVCVKKNCELSMWGEWSKCSNVWGQRYRMRSIKQHPANQGQPCVDPINETAPCLQKSDMVPCKLKTWAPWGPCDKECGGGQKSRERGIAQKSSHGGPACNGPLQEVWPCNTHKCVSATHKDCVLAEWGKWTPCNTSKETQSYRWRHVQTPAVGNGMPCHGELQQTTSCAEMGPHDCEFSEWNKWGPCSTSCKGGEQQRSRSIHGYALRGGQTCSGEMIMMRPCNVDIMCQQPTDCVMSEWEEWSACNPACGNGQKERKRVTKVAPGAGGKACPKTFHEVAVCHSAACAGDTDCKWQDWQEWEPCQPARGLCGIGYKRRKRDIAAFPVGAGRQCPPRIKEELMPVARCQNQMECCRDGKWGNWAMWSQCSVTCGGGTQSRQRTLLTKETWCGKPAPGSHIEFQNCAESECGKTDCVFNQWTPWWPETACRGSCSQGHKERTRAIQTHAHGGGAPCAGPIHEWERCPYSSSCSGFSQVPQDCVLGEWNQWSECSKTCSKGYSQRKRIIKIPPKYGGKPCNSSTLGELTACNQHVPCSALSPVSCSWREWSMWAACNENEEQLSTRTQIPAANGGNPCVGPVTKTRPCGICVNATYKCDWDAWADWGPCTTTCGTGGTRQRMRMLKIGTEPVMDKLFDMSMPKVGLSVVDDAAEKTEDDRMNDDRMEEAVSAIALGLISLAVALVSRSLCRCRRGESAKGAGAYEPVNLVETGELE